MRILDRPPPAAGFTLAGQLFLATPCSTERGTVETKTPDSILRENLNGSVAKKTRREILQPRTRRPTIARNECK